MSIPNPARTSATHAVVRAASTRPARDASDASDRGDADDPGESPALDAPAPRPPPQRFRPPRRFPFGKLALGLVLLGAAGGAAWQRLKPKPVTTTQVVRGTAVDAVYATGTVEAQDRVLVKAKVAGAVKLEVREGSVVKKGALLATIDSPTLRFDLQRGKADLWAASQQAGTTGPQQETLAAQAKVIEAQLKTATDDRDRLATLVGSGAATRADLDKAENAIAGLNAQLAANAAQRKSLSIDLSARAQGSSATVDSLAARLADAEVRSPLDGVVLSRSVEQGEYLILNAPIVKIGDVSTLILECSIDEADIGKVRLGEKAAISLYAFPAKIWRGEVFEILPDADRTKKTFLTKVKLLELPEGLRSGMSAEINLVAEERPGTLLAPADAIDAGGNVWVVRAGRVQRVAVKTGVRDMLRVEIVSGLAEGDEIVVGGGEGLAEGARVLPTLKPADAKAPMPGKGVAGGANAGSL